MFLSANIFFDQTCLKEKTSLDKEEVSCIKECLPTANIS
jgi:hypothetical protein